MGEDMVKHLRSGVLALVAMAAAFAMPAHAKDPPKRFTPQEVEEAAFKPNALKRSQPSALAVKVQVLLDRANASPSTIDGVYGESTIEAIRGFQGMTGVKVTGNLTQADWDKLVEAGGSQPILTEYKLKKKDVKGPFPERIPDDYKEKAAMKRLGYLSAAEGLAERFHMDEAFLRVLNPDAAFEKAGETITVVDPGKRLGSRVERIEVDGREAMLRAYDKDGKVLAVYPATVGSKDMPSPSGSLKVRAVARNPAYFYDPTRVSFNAGLTEKLRIAAGPNNPVGTVWIDLDKETYGIHGTADPAEVGKETSHGCVRMTNWDVEELAAQVRKGTAVEFVNVVASR
jgi:lipoprotein-anchoring transpeptidase ErfK/SrfK